MAAVLLADVSVASVFFPVAAVEDRLEGLQVGHQVGRLGRRDQQVGHPDHPDHLSHLGDQVHVDRRLNDRRVAHC